ncbi:MAG: hypothetical protein Q7U89_00165 [Coriobacteriia bacterium]|nr:hypothetical protein [Coriobacteriia bacterium]
MSPSTSGASSRRSTQHGLAPVLVALAVMVVWGGTPIFSKIAAAQIDPLLVGILRTVIAGCVAGAGLARVNFATGKEILNDIIDRMITTASTAAFWGQQISC